MIKYEFIPKTSIAYVDVDLVDAFEGTTGPSDFVVNAATEAQTAILVILSRMFTTIDYLLSRGRSMPEEHRKVIKESLIEIACQAVTLELFDEFLESTQQKDRIK
ncbi:MAG: hypothetical protein IJ088_07945 [Clostridia bacterium]|nr:hypothetical protein [Clostridia bacterium]